MCARAVSTYQPHPLVCETHPRKMAREVCSEEYQGETPQVQSPAEEDDSATQKEFDFIERPSEDFFCPVTFELLLNPHQTTCCGNHLSEKAVHRLQRDGKPCPMCKEPQLSTMPDKFHRRRVSAVHVRCPHTLSGCEWVGEVGVVDQHSAACLKRPWECQFCDFVSTSDLQSKHKEQCTKYPIPCPNECEIGTVPRCDVERHRTECPLEPVACEFADVGCGVKMARRDLKRHMEEGQQHHLLSATLLNLKLTKEAVAELNRQLIEKECKLDEKEHQLEENNRQLAQKDKILLEKEKSIAAKDKAFALMVAEKDRIIAEKETQLSELKEFRREFMESTNFALDRILEKNTDHEFVIKEFSVLQREGGYGDWFSDPLRVTGYELKLNLETKEKGSNMKIRLYPGHLHCSVTFRVNLQLLNQLGDHGHYSKKLTIKCNEGIGYSAPYDYITFLELYRRDKTVQYLKEDSLKLRMWIAKLE